MMHEPPKKFAVSSNVLVERRPSGVERAAWLSMSQQDRLSFRFSVMTDHDRAVAADLLSICPGGMGRDDWLAMTGDERIASMISIAQPPESCGHAIVSAIARGPFAVFQPVEMVPTGKDGWKPEKVGYRGRDAIRAADVFDRMVQEAMRRKRDIPVTPGQVAMGRHYRALVERHDAGGVKLSSVEAGRIAGGGGAKDFMDLRLEEARQLASIRRRIGGGAAIAVRRRRPSSRGVGAKTILDRALVDAVCLYDLTLAQVLRASGWSVDGKSLAAVRQALTASLDRMIGYRSQEG